MREFCKTGDFFVRARQRRGFERSVLKYVSIKNAPLTPLAREMRRLENNRNVTENLTATPLSLLSGSKCDALALRGHGEDGAKCRNKENATAKARSQRLATSKKAARFKGNLL